MRLQDFSTLAEAQAHTITTGTLIHRDSMNGWLGAAGIYKRMKEIAADNTHPYANTMEAFLDSVEYNFKQGTTTGDAHIALLDSLIDDEPTIGTQLAAVKPIVMARANVVSYPFTNTTQAEFDEAKDTGQIIALPANNSQHLIQINTTIQPLNPTDITIEHRFGTDSENLTDWHEAGRVRQVYYTTVMTGQPYKSGQIPATIATYRELRLVSPLTLGITVV